MTVQEVANRLVELCRKGDYETVYTELFSPDVVSIEPEGMPHNVAKGLNGIAKKGEQFNARIQEMHGGSVGDPIVAGNHFSCTMSYTATYKGQNQPTTEEEICVYEVKDGKIVKEQFFYTIP